MRLYKAHAYACSHVLRTSSFAGFARGDHSIVSLVSKASRWILVTVTRMPDTPGAEIVLFIAHLILLQRDETEVCSIVDLLSVRDTL